MVLAYHIIISAYGFWLPNDPRGSWSSWIRAWELFRYGGPATKVQTHRSVARKPHDRAARLAMKQYLKYPPVIFTGEQARSVALGFADAANEGGYVIHAGAVLPDHSHLVVARDGRLSEQIMSHLKRAASIRLREDGLHPFANTRLINGSLHTGGPPRAVASISTAWRTSFAPSNTLKTIRSRKASAPSGGRSSRHS